MNTCNRCNGTGEIVTCCDDLCANSDTCIHGDGYATCPTCKGEGFVPIDDEADDYTEHKQSERIYVEGNNGGDYFLMRPMGDNRVFLEIGSCCVVTMRHIVPIEFVTGALTEFILLAGHAYSQENMEDAFRKLGWQKDFQDKLLSQVQKVKSEYEVAA